jgi:hypothetical protein
MENNVDNNASNYNDAESGKAPILGDDPKSQHQLCLAVEYHEAESTNPNEDDAESSDEKF